MKKKLLILFTLMLVLSMALSITSLCYADGEEVPVAEETIEEEAIVEETEVAEETADNSALVWIKTTWEKIKPRVLGMFDGVTIGGIVAIIVGVIVRRGANKGFDKLEKNANSDTIADLSSKKILDNLSNVALDVNIKPVLSSQYKAMSEEINGELTINLQKQDKKNLAVINLVEKLGNYFDCSVAVSDEAKADFKQAVKEAKELYSNCDNKVSAKVEIKAEPNTEKKETKVSIAENYW